MTGVYVHVPFCKRKCNYCDFYSVTEQINEDLYIKRLLDEAEKYKGISADTLYFGGGTPSLLSAEAAERLINGLKNIFCFEKNSEITLEANPSSMDYEKLSKLRAAGVNRLSVGIQSGIDKELKMLGRLHDFKGAENAVNAAKKAGFENISVDMIIAIPHQTSELLNRSLDRLLSLEPNHISCYMLTLEEGTPLYYSNPQLLSDEMTASLYLELCKRLESQGFEHYEISNFAKIGFKSRHNLKYWRGEEYIGLGPAAHSYFGNKRYFNKRDLHAYLSGEDISECEEEQVDKAEDYLLLSLRLKEGISLGCYEALGGECKGSVLKKIKNIPSKYYILKDKDRLSLTDEGFLVSNEIISALL